MPIFSFPDDARWDETRQAVCFEVRLGEYCGQVVVPLRVLAGLAGQRPDPAAAVQQVELNRALFERAAEARLTARRLDADANIHLTGGDIRAAAGQ